MESSWTTIFPITVFVNIALGCWTAALVKFRACETPYPISEPQWENHTSFFFWQKYDPQQALWPFGQFSFSEEPITYMLRITSETVYISTGIWWDT